ncbi:enhancer of split malpha protein-like [Agrilus planipennis]|uniref:Enhancer of split malpha protein-like n=1 Tax=Agrilus planipennis TaxID=224129 RepID=A0A1W4XGQ5_AGRPL|nr:enhancer of split malpha protein-like [Agrilus planipennis]
MSSYYDYVIASNNSVNDNKLNAKKARSMSHQFKQLLKPLFGALKKNNKNLEIEQQQTHYYTTEVEDNAANEALEQRLFEEIDCCGDFAGVPVFNSNGHLEVIPVARGQRYIPVHFAKTEAGTFFWTTVTTPDHDIVSIGDKNAICCHQEAELQVPCDRWAQA